MFPLPVLAWLALPLSAALAMRRGGFFRFWGIAFAVLIALDAWLTGSLTPVRAGTPWETIFGVAFVVVGDFRFFLAAEWDGTAKSFARAVALAWIVPLASQALRATIGWVTAVPRNTFLTYEVLFLITLAGWYALRGRSLPRGRKLAAFVLVQYVLWAGVDVLILTSGSGAPLRHVPDVLYYVVFVPFVLLRA